MRLPVKARHLPPRIAAGAFIVNSGLGKWSADDETAAQLHGFAVGAYPFLAKLKPSLEILTYPLALPVQIRAISR